NRGELEKALRVETSIADSRPRDFFRNREVVDDYLLVFGDSARARHYAERASEAITPDVTEHNASGVASLELSPYISDWLAGDIASAARVVEGASSKIDGSNGKLRDAYAFEVALAHLSLGQLKKARSVGQRILDPVLQNAVLIQVSFFEGSHAELRDRLD